MSKETQQGQSDDSTEVYVGRVVKGELTLHDLEQVLPSSQAVLARRHAVESITSSSLEQLNLVLSTDVALSSHTENVIGAVAIPVGVVGPLLVHGGYASGNFYIPMATTERTLVASTARGAKATTKGGGVQAVVTHDGMTRAPLFRCESAVRATKLAAWVQEHDNFEQLQRIAAGTSTHGRLIGIRPFIAGNNIWLRCEYTTGDAMGMNMATIATDHVARHIVSEFPDLDYVALSGNLCADKKDAAINSLLGRGKSVTAEATIDPGTLRSVLHTTAAAICNVNNRKNLLGSAVAGSTKFNAHYANIISAIFLATGQDIAEVVESSSGYTWAEERGDAVYFSVTLPCLEVGTLGGGTALTAQAEALSIMGVAGPADPAGENSLQFAEITAAAVLAGELGLLAAIAANELGNSTAEYNRT